MSSNEMKIYSLNFKNVLFSFSFLKLKIQKKFLKGKRIYFIQTNNHLSQILHNNNNNNNNKKTSRSRPKWNETEQYKHLVGQKAHKQHS